MKLYNWLYGAMALTILGACTDRDLISDNGKDEGQGYVNTVNGYLAVEIKLPQEVASRAEDEGAMNDKYGDGTPQEYKVNNAMIILFKGAKEKDAKFFRAQNLEKPFFTNLPVNDPVAASYIAAIPVQKNRNSSDNFWALVVINRNKTSTKLESDDKGNQKLYLAGNEVLADRTTFKEVLDFTTTFSFLGEDPDKKEFFMINAPMSSKPAGEDVTGDDITYLTNLGNTIYDTPEEAKDKVAGCVYVERAVAKVTCTELPQNALQLTFFDENGEVDLTETGWDLSAEVNYALTNTAQNSYLIRNVDFAETDHFEWNISKNGRYRMVGTTPIPALSEPFHNQPKDLYRTYWCKDPHYSTPLTDAVKHNLNSETLESTAVEYKDMKFKDRSNTLYCKENTFQVQYMNYQNTTMAVFEVVISLKKDGEPYTKLYVRDGNTAKIYLNEESAYSDGITRIIRDLNVQNAIKAAVVEGKTLPANFSVKDHLDITIEDILDDSGLHYLEITDINLKTNGSEDFFDANSPAKFTETLGTNNKKNLLDNVNALTDVTVYPDCKSYYIVPIKHFGDYYTPWDKEKNKGTTTAEVYNNGYTDWTNTTHATNYLGRYGMVRNNWYELSISKIAALGSSVIPDTNISTSDDSNEDKKYFAVEIHILSWAKRLQNIEF